MAQKTALEAMRLKRSLIYALTELLEYYLFPMKFIDIIVICVDFVAD